MSNKKSLKAFVRFDGTGRVVLGSLILRQKTPKVGRWQEIRSNNSVILAKVFAPVLDSTFKTTLQITWLPAKVAHNMTPITHYNIILNNVEVDKVAAAAVLEYTYKGLDANTDYIMKIEAVDAKNTVQSAETLGSTIS